MMAYGDYDLRRGDRDSNFTYAGAIRSEAAGDVVPGPGERGFVQQLQEDLVVSGFRLVGTADGTFGQRTEWALREFQIYSKMPMLAREVGTANRYADRLAAVPNTSTYTGPVSGVANAETRACLQIWRADGLRCPVVIEAWNMSGGSRSSLARENIWRHDEVTDKSLRIFARDLTSYYELPPGHDPDIVLGRYVTYLKWSGPLTDPPRLTWPGAEILPENLIGQDLDSLTDAQLSTYKVVRSVSEVECIGFFDCLNAYDNAFVSGGPCHWTLGIVGADGTVSEGEMCGYLAYLRYADLPAFHKAIGSFGIKADEEWVGSDGPNGRDLFERSSRKYVGWIALQQQDGSYRRMRQDEQLGNYFKGWHWFYRFAMAGRTIEGWRRRMWDMARIRLRDIRSAPFPTGVLPDIPAGGGGYRRATVGDVYTSEKALAILLRWHIRFPGYVIAGGQAASRLCRAYERATIPDSAGHPESWMDHHERLLLTGLFDEIEAIGNSDLIKTISYVRNWPEWATGPNPRRYRLSPAIGELAETRNSFLFEDTGLPPAPF